LLEIQRSVPAIGDVRGLGCMLAIELVADRTTKEPDATRARAVIDAARERGLLLLTCGPHKNIVRLLPPLVAAGDDIGRALTILDEVLR
jgi:4-aminobutyrate aminotransferase-like enzyme